MVIRKIFDKKVNITNTCLSFFVGAFALVTLSFIQKVIAGYNPFILKGYLVSFFFGGITGTILGTYIGKVRRLNTSLKQRVNTLESFLPICSNCKKIRKPDSDPRIMDSWEQIESYISHKTSSKFSHGICPDCMKDLYGDMLNDAN